MGVALNHFQPDILSLAVTSSCPSNRIIPSQIFFFFFVDESSRAGCGKWIGKCSNPRELGPTYKMTVVSVQLSQNVGVYSGLIYWCENLRRLAAEDHAMY